jgi:hypothetical protein
LFNAISFFVHPVKSVRYLVALLIDFEIKSQCSINNPKPTIIVAAIAALKTLAALATVKKDPVNATFPVITPAILPGINVKYLLSPDNDKF